MRGIDMWREHRRCPIQQKTSQPIAQLGGAIEASCSGLLVLACPGQSRIRAMVKLADQLQRAFQRMKATVAMVTDVHHPPAGRTITIEDVEFPAKRNRYPQATCKASFQPPCLGEIRRLSRQDKRIDKKTLYF